MRELEADGVHVRVQIKSGYFGDTARWIVEAAQASRADLIVMGRSGSSNLRGTPLGGVTHKVLQLSDVPVLVSGPEATRAT